jgi:hypothetical protein
LKTTLSLDYRLKNSIEYHLLDDYMYPQLELNQFFPLPRLKLGLGLLDLPFKNVLQPYLDVTAFHNRHNLEQ